MIERNLTERGPAGPPSMRMADILDRAAVQRYNPLGIINLGETQNGFLIAVEDQNHYIPNLEVDVQYGNMAPTLGPLGVSTCYSDPGLCSEEAFFEAKNDPTVVQKALDAAVAMLEGCGYIVQLPSGEWVKVDRKYGSALIQDDTEEEEEEDDRWVDEYAQMYNPVGVEFTGEPGEGFSVMLMDSDDCEGCLWMDAWIEHNDVEMDWNNHQFNLRDPAQVDWMKIQENPIICDKAMDATMQFLVDKGCFIPLQNGDWTYGNYGARLDRYMRTNKRRTKKARASSDKFGFSQINIKLP